MLWTEAILNTSGPPEIGCAWPAAPPLPHEVACYPNGSGLKVPYITSEAVAEAWRVDHNTLCGKFLGHRRRKWNNENSPPLFYIWKNGPSPHSPLGIALMPAWANQRIAYSGLLKDRNVIPGLYKPFDRLQDFPNGFFDREEKPPFLPRWQEDWVPRRHLLVGSGQPARPNDNPEDQGAPAGVPYQGKNQEQLPYGPGEGPMVQWKAVAGMVWNRPDPGDTPMEDPYGQQRQAPQECHGDPSGLAPGAIPTSSSSSKNTGASPSRDFGHRLGQAGPLRHQGHLPREKREGSPAHGACAVAPHQLRPSQGLRPLPILTTAKGPGTGSFRLNTGGLHLHRGLCPGRDMQGRRPLQGHRQPPVAPHGSLGGTHPRIPTKPVPPARHRPGKEPCGKRLRGSRRAVLAGGQLPGPHGHLPHPHGPGPNRIRAMVSPCQEELHRVPARRPRPQVLKVRVRLRRARLWLPQWLPQRTTQPFSGSNGGAQAAVAPGSWRCLLHPELQTVYIGDMPQRGAPPPPLPPSRPTEALRSQGAAGRHPQVLMVTTPMVGDMWDQPKPTRMRRVAARAAAAWTGREVAPGATSPLPLAHRAPGAG